MPITKDRTISPRPLALAALFLLAISLAACGGPSDLARYEQAIQPVFDEWTTAINTWDAAANDPNRLSKLDLEARAARLRMEAVITSWCAIDVPPETQEYHRLMGLAMSYEQQAFDNMEQYYRLGIFEQPKSSTEFEDLRIKTIEFWNKKDEALSAAIEADPTQSGMVIRIGGR